MESNPPSTETTATPDQWLKLTLLFEQVETIVRIYLSARQSLYENERTGQENPGKEVSQSPDDTPLPDILKELSLSDKDSLAVDQAFTEIGQIVSDTPTNTTPRPARSLQEILGNLNIDLSTDTGGAPPTIIAIIQACESGDKYRILDVLLTLGLLEENVTVRVVDDFGRSSTRSVQSRRVT